MDTTEPSPKKKKPASRTARSFWITLRKYTQLRDDTDYPMTVESISKSVEFRGVNVWILFFAIIVASVGLNVNSTAVIIGAMLISPLMGPINGIGLSVGILDEDLLRKSLKNLVVMVLISLTASTLYFLISPISDAQSELLARTRPTIFDVFIAFFGGLAGIVATSRKSQPFTVISGVAIATALMPPLCTAGFGIATGQLGYFLGAFYLFFINSFFIALATYLMVRFLGFPKKNFSDAKRKRKEKRIVSIFTVVVLVPSIFLAIDVVRESAFNTQSIRFVNDIQDNALMQNTQIIKYNREYHPRSQTIELSLVGKTLSNESLENMQNIIHDKYGLKNARLIVRQTGETIDITQQNEIIENMIQKKEDIIQQQDSTIRALEQQISKITGTGSQAKQVAMEIQVQYPGIEEMAIANMEYYNPKTMGHRTIPTLYIRWKNGSGDAAKEKTLAEWLKVRLQLEELRIIH